MNLFLKIDKLGKNINNKIDKYKELILVLMLFLFFIIYIMLNRSVEFYGDGAGYYKRIDYFINDGKFALVNYRGVIRGYAWPLLLTPIKLLSEITNISHFLIFRIALAIFSSGFFAILIPRFVEKAFQIKINFLQRLFFCIMVFYFWAPMFLHPLADLPAFMFNIAGLYLLYSAYIELRNDKKQKSIKRYILIFFAGMFIALTSVIRPVYQLGIYMSVILIMVLSIKKKDKKWPIMAMSFIIGAAIAFAPQVLINVTRHGIFSPYPQGQLALGRSLLILQLKEGLRLNEAITYIGSQEITNRVFIDSESSVVKKVQDITFFEFPNIIGNTLLDRIGEQNITTFFGYLVNVAKYPFEFLALIGTHFFAGMDLNFPDIYLTEMKPAGKLFSLLNLSAIFLACRYTIKKRWFKEDWLIKTIMFTVIITPCLIALISAMEERFMIPLHMILYMLLAFNPEIKNLFTTKHKFNAGIILIYLIYIALAFSFSAMLLSLGGINMTF
jgi:hypothetical protein